MKKKKTLGTRIIIAVTNVTCPGKTCTPWMRTVRQPSLKAVRSHTA